MIRKKIRYAVLVGLALLAVGMSGVFAVGSILSAPVHASIGQPPEDLPVEVIEFDSDSGSTIRGWFIPGTPGSGAVVLMHGVQANRGAMIPRARFLHNAGYAVLLFDFQAHGESPGDRITFGYREAMDARAAVDYVRTRLPGERIAAVGTSLGGAACLLGDVPLDVDALVLEAVYPDIESAIANRLRMRLSTPGAWLTPLLTWQIKPRIGIGTEKLRPIDTICNVRCPILLIAGTTDRHTTIEESRRLFAAGPEPKQIWEIQGAAHVDFYRFGPVAYEARVGEFLNANLRRE